MGTRAGLRGLAIRRVDGGQLAAWATDWPDNAPPLGRADLLEHHALVEQLHADLDACLPVRFPTWFADAAQLRQRLEEHQAELGAKLEHVRGRSELSVTILEQALDGEARLQAGGSDPSHQPLPGTRYLLERQQRQRTVQELIQQIEATLGADLVSAQHAPWPRAGVVLSSALLVPTQQAGSLAERLKAMGHQGSHPRILLNGPWPPYSFAGALGVRKE
jgi:hypothetical protein